MEFETKGGTREETDDTQIYSGWDARQQLSDLITKIIDSMIQRKILGDIIGWVEGVDAIRTISYPFVKEGDKKKLKERMKELRRKIDAANNRRIGIKADFGLQSTIKEELSELTEDTLDSCKHMLWPMKSEVMIDPSEWIE